MFEAGRAAQTSAVIINTDAWKPGWNLIQPVKSVEPVGSRSSDTQTSNCTTGINNTPLLIYRQVKCVQGS